MRECQTVWIQICSLTFDEALLFESVLLMKPLYKGKKKHRITRQIVFYFGWAIIPKSDTVKIMLLK